MTSPTAVAPGPETRLEAGALDELRQRLRGALLLPGEPVYDEARALWNGMFDRRPALIGRCLGVADVLALLSFAREHGLPVSIKGGGHNVSGMAACDGGVMLDMSLMRGVWVDPARRTARAQAGCLLGDVDRETQVHGLAASLGFVSATGIAGLTLGGGFGYLTRRVGWTCDTVTAMDMVTAEGRVVRASERENTDLLWALRGGGGNFGVVMGFEYRLCPVGPDVVGGLIAWPAAAAERVLEMYRGLAETAPPELTCALVLRLAPPAPWLAPQVHGKPVVALVVCHSGSLAKAHRDLAPVKAFGTPAGDVVQPRPYASQQSILDPTQPRGRRYYWKSEYLPGLSSELLAGAAEHARRITSPHSAVVIFPVGGALDRLPADHSAVGNRDAAFVLNVTASWESAAEDQTHIEWARSAWGELRRHSTGGTYVNFLTEEEVGDRVRAAYGQNYERLVEAKTRWDPGNFFRVNKNIAPQSP